MMRTLIKMGLILAVITNSMIDMNKQTECNINLLTTYDVKKIEKGVSGTTIKQVDPKVEDQDMKSEIVKNIKPKVEVVDETFTLTFYTDLAEENGPYGSITCNGKRLTSGMVANNVLPQGTKIITKEFGELVVSDKGGNNFNKRSRLDVFIPRNKGETDRQYKRRVNNMGMVKVKGHKI